MTIDLDMTDVLAAGRQTLKEEAAVLQHLAGQLDETFERVVEAILACAGRVVVSGMGKSGLIGRKISATLASTGTPSFYVHPGEAFHGDLGMVQPEDTVLLLSRSGETDEVLRLVPFFKDNGNRLIAMTGRTESTLGRACGLHLRVEVPHEACPLDLAPTASTTAMLALGDALAMALMRVRDFRPEQFARLHPGGTLGRKLLTRVADVMRRDELPVIAADTPIQEVIHHISAGRLGLAVVLSEDGAIAGIITDGDVRRAMQAREQDFFRLSAADLMSRAPKTIAPSAKLTEAAELMHRHKIGALLVVEHDELSGVIQVYDLRL